MLLPMASGFGVSLETMSAAATLYYLMYGLMQPVWAIISDRIGRVVLVRLGLAIAALAGFACVVSTTPSLVIGARAVSGALLAGVIPASLVWVGESLPGEERSGTSRLMSGIYSGTVVASLVGAGAAQFGQWRVAMLASAVVSAVLALALLRQPASGTARRFRVVDTVRNPMTWEVVLVIGLAVVEGAAVHGMLTYFPAATADLGVGFGVAGLSVAVFGVGVVIASRWVQKSSWSRRVMMLTGGCVITAALTLAAFGSIVGVVGMLVAALALGAGFAGTHAPLQAWATSAAPRGRSIAVACFVGGALAGAAIATALGSAAASAGDFGALFGVAAVAAALLTVVLSRRA